MSNDFKSRLQRMAIIRSTAVGEDAPEWEEYRTLQDSIVPEIEPFLNDLIRAGVLGVNIDVGVFNTANNKPDYEALQFDVESAYKNGGLFLTLGKCCGKEYSDYNDPSQWTSAN